MWDRVSFKAVGKVNFKANYWPCIAVSLLLALLIGNAFTLNIGSYSSDFSNLIHACRTYGIHTGEDLSYVIQCAFNLLLPAVASGTLLSLAISLLVANPFEVGASRFFLESTSFHPARFSRVSLGFTGNFGNVVLTQFLRNLFIFLWSLLFLIPGIVRSYGYFAVPYILSENPSMPYKQALDLSRSMTMGYKGDIFITDLSFLGWHFLSALTFGILGVFYVSPYICATNAEIYRFLRAKAIEQGIASPEELPGMGSL
ncbi:MAG: DUF975 family protein [Ruminiclostridium sp.]|nr:DUF975 family protein [Ruminiclostridium sp.]